MALPPINPYIPGLPYEVQEFMRQVRNALSGVAGIATFTSASIAGVADGSNAPAGYIGEYQSTTVTAASPTSYSGGDVTLGSVTLTPGDWDVQGTVNFGVSVNGNANADFIGCLTTGSSVTQNDSYSRVVVTTPNVILVTFNTITVNTPITRFNSANTQTVNLVVNGYSIPTAGDHFWGHIRARRVR